jgi:hypothetical protein
MTDTPTRAGRRKFSPNEDDALRALVAEYGTEDWIRIASRMPRRDSRQCKERWYHYLSPALMPRPWSQEDDALLQRRVMEQGRTWKHFEMYFPGRTYISIKNRYNVLARRRLRSVRLNGGVTLPARSTQAPPPLPPDDDDFSEGLSSGDVFDWDDFTVF